MSEFFWIVFVKTRKGVAYSFEKRPNNAQEHFKSARQIILDKIDSLTEKFDAESEKEKSDEKVMSDLTNEIAQLKDILPDLNSKLEDIEATINNKGTSKVQEHLETSVSTLNYKINRFWTEKLNSFSENRGLRRRPGHPALGQAQAGGEGEDDGVGREEAKNGGISSLFPQATHCLVINFNQVFSVIIYASFLTYIYLHVLYRFPQPIHQYRIYSNAKVVTAVLLYVNAVLNISFCKWYKTLFELVVLKKWNFVSYIWRA